MIVTITEAEYFEILDRNGVVEWDSASLSTTIFVPEDDLGLGESCDPILQNCVTENAECVGDPGSATCQCMEGFLQEGENCEAWNPGLGEPCHPELAPCTAENAECVGEPGSQTCQCEEGLVQDGEICRMPFLGEECDPGLECAAENSDCLEHAGVWTCQCSMGFVQEQADCKIPAGGDCADSTECVSNAECTSDGNGETCMCQPGFQELFGFCTEAKSRRSTASNCPEFKE
ncbi:unnamed protein product [Darwinula stevensoni]|uniref:EGF-like domain-containing protein n=1 Tax=Darwinula stevensoni TaxID=69355 RepID=A0A7R9FTB2_9CRUS|nr:unnamed protein product [Darwinula stevensoni]CAG0905632.1 unnamed protein product [Darwinula stevensoni]